MRGAERCEYSEGGLGVLGLGQVSATMNGNAGTNFGRTVLLRAYLNW